MRTIRGLIALRGDLSRGLPVLGAHENDRHGICGLRAVDVRSQDHAVPHRCRYIHFLRHLAWPGAAGWGP